MQHNIYRTIMVARYTYIQEPNVYIFVEEWTKQVDRVY